MLLAGEQSPLSSPRRRHNGHGRTCHWFGPVANGPKRSFCLEQTSCEQFDIASDQSPMVSVIGRGGYCYECHQKTLPSRGRRRLWMPDNVALFATIILLLPMIYFLLAAPACLGTKVPFTNYSMNRCF